MTDNFKKEFERYKEAVTSDIQEMELVISWLEQFRANFEDKEIEKVISFFKGYLARAKFEKQKTTELSWHIEEIKE
jgi:hypothetical protein